MNITDKRIDNGTPFDRGRTSENYAKYRDIYPAIFYKKIAGIGLCLKGQTVLDLKTEESKHAVQSVLRFKKRKFPPLKKNTLICR